MSEDKPLKVHDITGLITDAGLDYMEEKNFTNQRGEWLSLTVYGYMDGWQKLFPPTYTMEQVTEAAESVIAYTKSIDEKLGLEVEVAMERLKARLTSQQGGSKG